MKRLTAAFWICILLTLLCMSCRLVWLASGTETGLQTLKTQWRDASIGLVMGEQVPICSREPVEQAEFWLTEVDRVAAAHPEDAQIVMGAALVLDSPGTEYQGRYLSVGSGGWPELDRQGIERAEDEFRSRCDNRCLQLAARATELDPSNLHWWRLRALLQVRRGLWSAETKYATDWAETLDECARHDPDNGLYDYLAAQYYWDSGAEMDWSGSGDGVLIVNNAEQFNRGVTHFERAQAKPCVVVGDAGFPAVHTFLGYTNRPITDHEQVANSRLIHLRRTLLLRSVWRWQQHRADEEVRAGNIRLALAMKRQNLHLISQFANAGTSAANDAILVASRVMTAATMNKLAEEHRDLLSPEELAEIGALDRTSRLQQKVGDEARSLLPQIPNTMLGASRAMLSGLLVVTIPSFVVILLLIGCAATVSSRISSARDISIVGPIWRTVALLVACAVTIVVFGLAPAEVISRDVQAWALTILIILAVIAFVAWIVYGCLRRRAFQFSIREMLMFTSVVAALAAFLSCVRLDLPLDLYIPERGLEGRDPALEKTVVDMIQPNGSWLWAAWQWLAYHGHYLTVAVWLGIMTVLFVAEARKAKEPEGEVNTPRPGFRDLTAAFLRMLGRSSVRLSALTLIAYLALAPNYVRVVESQFQSKIAFIRQPSAYWAKMDEAVETVRSDEDLMDQLKDVVDAEMAETPP